MEKRLEEAEQGRRLVRMVLGRGDRTREGKNRAKKTREKGEERVKIEAGGKAGEEEAARLTDTSSAINLPFARSRYLSVLRDQPRHRRLREKPGGPPSLAKSTYNLEQPRQSRWVRARIYTRVPIRRHRLPSILPATCARASRC